MKILATGMTGFLGSWTLKALLGRGHRICAVRRPQSSMARLGEWARHPGLAWLEAHDADLEASLEGVDIVLHCATHYGRAQFDPGATIESNILLPLRLLALAARKGVGCFINTDTVLDKRISAYALSKHQFAEWLDAYAGRIKGLSLAMEHFYGGLDDPTKFTSHVIRTMARGEGALDLTPGAQKRYFLHVSDAAQALLLACENWHALGALGHERLEVGSESPMTVRGFVEEAWRQAGRPDVRLNFGALPYREGEVMEPRIDISGARALGWSPRVGIAEGLADAIRQERSALAPASKENG